MQKGIPQNGCEGIGGGTVPVLIGEDLLAVFALVDGLIAILTLLLEVFTERVEDGAGAGARVLLVPSKLQGRGEQLVTVLTAVHLLVCTHTRARDDSKHKHAARELMRTYTQDQHCLFTALFLQYLPFIFYSIGVFIQMGVLLYCKINPLI